MLAESLGEPTPRALAGIGTRGERQGQGKAYRGSSEKGERHEVAAAACALWWGGGGGAGHGWVAGAGEARGRGGARRRSGGSG